MPSALHSVTVTPAAGGAPVDISALVESVKINHGRDDDLGQPEASSATLDVLALPADSAIPAALDIGATLAVNTTTPNGTWQRFAGRVTDMSLGWVEADEDTPDHGAGQVVAVGLLADTGRRVVGDVPFPQELDGARVARIMQLAGITLDPAYSDPGTVQIIARDIDSQPALNVAQDAAVSASGMVWQTRAGDIRYSDAVHRRGVQPSLVLDAGDILVTPTWRRSIEGLVNDVSVGYGVTPEGGEQPRYLADEPTSKAKWGTYGYSITTALAALADAQALGQLLLVRNSKPIWLMASLPIAVQELDQARYEQLLALDVHSLVTLTGLPAISSAPTSANLWVEGWSETLTYGEHEIELAVSGYCRTVPAPRWDDVSPSWIWGSITLNELRRNRNPYGSLRLTSGTNVTVRTNLVTNPGAEAAAVNWLPNNASNYTHSLDTSFKRSGAQSLKSTPAAGTVGTTRTLLSAYNVGGTFAAAAGTIYTLSCYVAHNAAVAGEVNLYMQFLDAGSAVLATLNQGTYVPAPNGQAWTRVSYTTNAAPANTASGRIIMVVNRASGQANIVAGEFAWADDVLVEASGGALLPYFDGSTPADTTEGITYSFSGTAHASSSLAVAGAANVTGWSVSGGVAYRAPDGRVRFLSKSAGGAILYPANVLPATPADTWSAGAKVIGAGGNVRIEVDTYNAAFANTKVNPGAYVPCSDTGARPICEAVSGALIPSDTTGIRPILRWDTAGGTYTVGEVIAELAATIGAYFDGSTPDTNDVDYAWAGAVDASESVLSEIIPVLNGVPASLTWDDAACFGPPINIGRWDDQPATLRWDQVPATTTWNNFGG